MSDVANRETPEIEITPEMVEASVDALSEFYMDIRERCQGADENAVASIFVRC